MTIRSLALLMLAPTLATADAPGSIELFRTGEGGYASYRIPGIVATRRGTLLAYAEARRGPRGDWGANDLVIRRGENGGATWGPIRPLVARPSGARKNPVALAQGIGREGEVTLSNATAIADPTTGVVHVLYCVEYARCYAIRSVDDGLTFSEPVDITPALDAFRPEYDWRVVATGPGHGIHLASGRLIVPVWLSTGAGAHGARRARPMPRADGSSSPPRRTPADASGAT